MLELSNSFKKTFYCVRQDDLVKPVQLRSPFMLCAKRLQAGRLTACMGDCSCPTAACKEFPATAAFYPFPDI